MTTQNQNKRINPISIEEYSAKVLSISKLYSKEYRLVAIYSYFYSNRDTDFFYRNIIEGYIEENKTKVEDIYKSIDKDKFQSEFSEMNLETIGTSEK
jgi:hypothetical protein